MKWLYNWDSTSVKNMALASRGMLGPNNNVSRRRVNNAYNASRRLTKQFNYMPKLNKYNYIYRGYKGKNFTFNSINTRMGMSSWSLNPNVARIFSVGPTNRKPIVLRMPTRFLKNVRVGNLSTWKRRGTLNEEEVILPPMHITINKTSASNGIANVTNIRVNGKYVRNGSNTKTLIGRNVARRLPVNKPAPTPGFLSRFRRR